MPSIVSSMGSCVFLRSSSVTNFRSLNCGSRREHIKRCHLPPSSPNRFFSPFLIDSLRSAMKEVSSYTLRNLCTSAWTMGSTMLRDGYTCPQNCSVATFTGVSTRTSASILVKFLADKFKVQTSVFLLSTDFAEAAAFCSSKCASIASVLFHLV